MPQGIFSQFAAKPLLDIRSLGRKGPGRRDRISAAEAEVMRRTLHRDPEVLVKVVSKGGQDLKAIADHLKYIGREGEVELADDEGRMHQGKDAADAVITDWNLDLQEHRPRFALRATDKGKPPKLVHKLIFSMPAGTPPDKVFASVQNFAREEWALQHRYVLALHTDQPHPHVHVLVKAVSEQGVRLNIRKATLRMWRSEFARHLREQGVRANATDRLARGRMGRAPSTEVYRGMARGALTKSALRQYPYVVEQGKRTDLPEVMSEVRQGWARIADKLVREHPSAPERNRNNPDPPSYSR